MPGLVPAIHVAPRTLLGVNGRDKPGHDAWGWRFPVSLLPELSVPAQRSLGREDDGTLISSAKALVIAPAAALQFSS